MKRCFWSLDVLILVKSCTFRMQITRSSQRTCLQAETVFDDQSTYLLCRLLSLPRLTLMEGEKSSAFAASPPHLIIASPHRLCPGYMTTPTFLLARGAGDAALDRGG